ncbi:hypothetical protein CsSME_00045360 [Camellia sinensis var. sinensis]
MPQVGLTPQVHQARHKSLHSAKLTSSEVLAQLRFMSSRCLATQQCASEGPQLSRQANPTLPVGSLIASRSVAGSSMPQ